MQVSSPVISPLQHCLSLGSPHLHFYYRVLLGFPLPRILSCNQECLDWWKMPLHQASSSFWTLSNVLSLASTNRVKPCPCTSFYHCVLSHCIVIICLCICFLLREWVFWQQVLWCPVLNQSRVPLHIHKVLN